MCEYEENMYKKEGIFGMYYYIFKYKIFKLDFYIELLCKILE